MKKLLIALFAMLPAAAFALPSTCELVPASNGGDYLVVANPECLRGGSGPNDKFAALDIDETMTNDEATDHIAAVDKEIAAGGDLSDFFE